MAWELDSRRSIYGQLMDVILKRIVRGVYPPGSKLDSVRDLAAEAGVNPNTMQRALSELERSGMISTQRTSGKYVTEDTALIEETRTRMAGELVRDLFEELEGLSFDRDGINEIIGRINYECDNGMS